MNIKTRPLATGNHRRFIKTVSTLIGLFLLAVGATPARAAVKIWDGSSSSRWSVAANWSGGIAPVNGDDLVFPDGASRNSVSNDFAALRLNSIVFTTVTGLQYSVSGNPIVVSNNISSQSPSNRFNFFYLPVTSGKNQILSSDNDNAGLYFYGAVDLGATTVTDIGSGNLHFNDGISGTGGITKNGTGIISFSGGSANTYTGATVVNAGGLILVSAAHNEAVVGPLIIGDGLGGLEADTVYIDDVRQIGNSVPVTINSSGLLNLSPGTSDAFGALSGNGRILLQTNTDLEVNVDNSSSTFGGYIYGRGNFWKDGTGTLTLNGNNAYTGLTLVYAPTPVEGGTLLVNGLQPQSDVTISSGCTLGGSGTVGSVTVPSGATISPGSSTGILTCSNATFSPGSSFIVELNGTAPGTNYDQLKVAGPLALGNATLVALLGFPPAVSNTFTIINKTSAGAVSGTFDGLPQGTAFNIGGDPFRISYSGGDGNDVVLTRLQPTGATLTWNGSSNGNWNTAANWTPGSVPVNGDSLLFPANAAHLTNTNNITDLRVNSLTLATGTNDCTLRGNFITLTNGITAIHSNSAIATINLSIQLGAGQTFSNVSATMIVWGNITNNGHLLTLTGPAATELFGVLSGTGGLTLNGQALLVGTNTYSGLTTVNGGLVDVYDASTFGSAAVGTARNGGYITLRDVTVLNESLTNNSALGSLRSVGNSGWSGNIVLNADLNTEVFTNGALDFLNSVSGSGALIKTGAGQLYMSDSTANTYTNTTWVKEGDLLLNKTAINGTIVGPLIIGDGIGGTDADKVYVSRVRQIGNAVPVTINSSGLLDIVSGKSDAFGALSGNGHILLEPGTDLEVNIDNTSSTFGGVISGGGNFWKRGTGTMILTGTNTYIGATLVEGGGTLIVNGSQPSSAMIVSNGATLGGSGTVGSVTATNAIISPGESAGILSCGALVVDSTDIVRIELNGITPGAGHDQLNVTGPVTLANAALSATLGFASTVSNTFTIINKASAGPVSGTFGGLPQNATFNISGIPFRISYTGGTGNDVVLTQLLPLPSLTSAQIGGPNLVFSWPTNYAGFTLESNTNLAESVWTVVSPPPAVLGANNVVTNSILGAQKYFRLRAP